jgi:hypothetical protein
MADNRAETSSAEDGRHGVHRVWRTVGWVLVGLVSGAVLLGIFLAYGQPELLLEQLNLRYCG